MLLKAGLIVAVFMHMAWERLALIYAILVPPAAVLVFVAHHGLRGEPYLADARYFLRERPVGTQDADMMPARLAA